MFNSGIELNSLEPYLDQIGFGNPAFLESSEIDLKQLLKSLPILDCDFHVVPAQQSIEIKVFHFRNAAPHRVRQLRLGCRHRDIRNTFPQISLAAQFESFCIGDTDLIQLAERCRTTDAKIVGDDGDGWVGTQARCDLVGLGSFDPISRCLQLEIFFDV